MNPRIVWGGSRAGRRDAVRMVPWVGIDPGNGEISVSEGWDEVSWKCSLGWVQETFVDVWSGVICSIRYDRYVCVRVFHRWATGRPNQLK